LLEKFKKTGFPTTSQFFSKKKKNLVQRTLRKLCRKSFDQCDSVFNNI